ncbi:MAG: calcium/sodium antiporter [Bacteroidota bacterium]|nr:calcium/sodium antiporter [Bacteroidota bacterium]
MIIYILFILGFFFLIKGADVLVNGATIIARRIEISDMIIGLTIVSFGTSMPELIVSIISAVKGNADLAIGNILGSNIANILLILGISAMITELPIRKTTVLSEIPFSLIATLLMGFLANAALFESRKELMISRIDGFILLFFFTLFLIYIFKAAKEEVYVEEKSSAVSGTLSRSIFMIIIGIIALFLGGKWVVDGAVLIAGNFGMSQSFIGLTVVAVGTSLPELVTSAIAAFKKKADIAVGNVIGSNIFNILWILGLSAVIRPLPFEVISNMDIVMIIFTSSLLLIAISLGKTYSIGRLSGFIFFIGYLAYLWYLVERG